MDKKAPKKSAHRPRALVLVSASALLIASCSEADGGEAGAVAIGKLDCGGSAGAFHFEYTVVEYSNGDVWVSCSVADNYAESAESSFWFAGSDGADVGGCAVTMDVSGENTSGWWSFEMTAAGAIAVYHDVGDAADGNSVTLGSDVCVYVEPT